MVLLFTGCGSRELTSVDFCEKNGWVSSGEICLFNDGSYCKIDSFVNGKCETGEDVHSVENETSFLEYCVDNWGQAKAEEGTSLCLFADGSYCEVGTYFNGECIEGEMIYNAIDKNVETEETNRIENTEKMQEFAEELLE